MVCIYGIFRVPSSLSGCPDLIRQPVLIQTCLILMSYTGESQPNVGEIYRFRAWNYYLYMMICLYICRAVPSLSCCCTVNSNTDFVSQKQSSSSKSNCQSSNPSMSNRQTSTILRQNVMPILLTSVINSTPRKTNNTSIIKGEPLIKSWL